MIQPCVQVIIICFVFGGILKNLTRLNNDLIPYIIALFGALVMLLFKIAGCEFSDLSIIECITIGIMSGLSSTGTHQVYKTLQNIIGGGKCRNEL